MTIQEAIHDGDWRASTKFVEYKGERKYVRLKNSDKVFDIKEDKVRALAAEAGALRKISNMVFINISKMEAYMESFEIFE